MNSEEDEWNKIFEIIDGEESNSDRDEKQKNEKQSFPNLISIERILKDKFYYLNKWIIIIKHLVNLDDYYLALEEIIKKKEDANSSASVSILKYNKNRKDKSMNNSKLKNELNEFKFKYAFNSLSIFENEKMSGSEFENYVRRTIYLILILIKKDNYKIYNPKKVPLKIIEMFYEKYKILLDKKKIAKDKITNNINEDNNRYNESFSLIKEDNNSILKDNTSEINEFNTKKKDIFEIDIIINKFKVKDLKRIISKYPQHFFFVENLKLDETKEKEVNIIGECVTNLIFQANNKYEQSKIYIKIFNGLEAMKLAILNKKVSEEERNIMKSIINDIKINDNSLNNIFMIITNGSYLLITFTFNLVERLINKNNKELDEKLMNEEIEQNKECLEHFLGHKMVYYPQLIVFIYKLFNDLRENSIKFFIMYINDKSENILDIYYSKNKNKLSFWKLIDKKNYNFININNENILLGKKEENENDLEDIFNLRNEIKNILDIKRQFDIHFEEINQDLNKLAAISEINVFEDCPFKLKLKIYSLENIKIEQFKNKYEIEMIKMEEDSVNYVKNLITNNIKKNFEEETFYIIISKDIHSKLFTMKNIVILLDTEFKSLESFLSEIFQYYEFETNFLAKIEQKKNLIFYQSTKTNISFPLKYIDFIDYIKKKLSPDFKIDDNNFLKVYNLIKVDAQKAKELAEKINKSINRVGKKYNIIPVENLEKTIQNNIQLMEETIKCVIFYDNLRNGLFTQFCINSIKHKYYNS